LEEKGNKPLSVANLQGILRLVRTTCLEQDN